jgi:hypothetical protein
VSALGAVGPLKDVRVGGDDAVSKSIRKVMGEIEDERARLSKIECGKGVEGGKGGKPSGGGGNKKKSQAVMASLKLAVEAVVKEGRQFGVPLMEHLASSGAVAADEEKANIGGMEEEEEEEEAPPKLVKMTQNLCELLAGNAIEVRPAFSRINSTSAPRPLKQSNTRPFHACVCARAYSAPVAPTAYRRSCWAAPALYSWLPLPASVMLLVHASSDARTTTGICKERVGAPEDAR